MGGSPTYQLLAWEQALGRMPTSGGQHGGLRLERQPFWEGYVTCEGASGKGPPVAASTAVSGLRASTAANGIARLFTLEHKAGEISKK